MCLALAACARERPLRLGATFTLEQSGALAGIDTLWEGRPFQVIIGASGQTLRSAAAGDLDIVITHAPGLEQSILVGPGLSARACPLFASRFGIVGPATDPASIRDLQSAVEAMRRIARVGTVFVSRGDSSGTHQKERQLWRLAGVDPDGELWHLESGGSQAANVRQAEHWSGYTLVDLPTWGAMHENIELQLLMAPFDTLLQNPYTLYLVKPPAGLTAHPGAAALADWLTTAWRAHVLGLQLPDGQPAFVKRDGECST